MSNVVIAGDTSGTVTLQAPAVAGSTVINLPATNGTTVTTGDSATVTPTMLSQPITLATAISLSGSSVSFSSIPSWVKRITLIISGATINGANNLQVQFGTSGGIVTTGYLSSVSNQGGGTVTNDTTSFIIANNVTSGESHSGIVTFATVGSNNWASSGLIKPATGIRMSAGNKILTGALTTVQFMTSGVNTFTAGTANIIYE
jgi:hypothetical protein